jgi:hypothetical protein
MLWPEPKVSRGARGDDRVPFRSNYAGAMAALTLAAVLSGCASSDVFDSSERWFSRPFDWTGREGGYTFSELQETNAKRGPVTANDLVSPNGACPPPPMVAAPPPPPNAAAAPGAMPGAANPMPASPGPPSLLGAGVALGMTECQVVYRAGTPASVQLGSNPNGVRVAVLTYNAGPRPGIYRFEGGRLMDMDRVEVPVDEPKVAKRAVRKKKVPERPEQQISTE